MRVKEHVLGFSHFSRWFAMETEGRERVAVGALKARLSEYLRLVKAGRELVVTERGRPIARIQPIHRTEAEDRRLDMLIAGGVLRPAIREPQAGFWRRERGSDLEGRSLDLLLSEREDGR
jgi:prevent-host-death family protein